MVICVILTPFPFYKNIIFFQADIVLIKVVLYLPNFSLMFLIHVFLYAGVYCIRCCSLTGPLCGWSAVMLSDRRYPSFWNLDSTISIDVIRMKSYMDSLFDPTCVPVRVTINKLNFFPNRKMPHFVSVFRNCGGLRTSKPYISVVFFYPVLHRSPFFPDVYFAALARNFIDNTVLFSWFKGVFRSH